MARIHMLLQGKGGVGKSFIASVLAQYKLAKGQKPLCIDTDPVNATFFGFKALKVQRLQLMDGEEINPRNFDALVELVAPSKHDVIIDNGASSFVQLAHYLVTNEVPQLLQGMGHELVIHSVITGGQAFQDTLHNLRQIVPQFPAEAVFIVWLNPYWGPIESNGQSFEQMEGYAAMKNRLSALVTIPTLKAETYGRDLTELLQSRQTFDEALAKDTLTIMTRQRLKIVRDQLYAQLDNAAVL